MEGFTPSMWRDSPPVVYLSPSFSYPVAIHPVYECGAVTEYVEIHPCHSLLMEIFTPSLASYPAQRALYQASFPLGQVDKSALVNVAVLSCKDSPPSLLHLVK